MGETTTLDRPVSLNGASAYFPPATFEESAIETSPEIDAARANIERSRTEMSQTIDAIKAQLAPERLVAEAKEAVAQAASDKVDEVKHAVAERVSDVAHNAAEVASNVVASVSDAAASLGEKALSLTDTVKDKWNDMTADNADGSSNGVLLAAGAGVVAAAGVVGATSKKTGDYIMDTIRENPVPAALVGVGLGWLLIDAVLKQQNKAPLPPSGTAAEYGYRSDIYGVTPPSNTNGTNGLKNGLTTVVSTASEKLHDATDKVSDAFSDATAKVSDTASDLQHKASDLIDAAQSKTSDLVDAAQSKASDFGNAAQTNTQYAIRSTKQFALDNPIAVGAVALLAGAVIGLAIPATDPENQLLGAHRDRLADQAGQQAHDLLNKVQNIAGVTLNVAKSSLSDATNQVQSTVQDQARQQGLIAA